METMEENTEEFDYLCVYCNEDFSTKQTLRIHTKLHTGFKIQFRCELCDYSSNYKGNLIRHLRQIHTTTADNGGKRGYERKSEEKNQAHKQKKKQIPNQNSNKFRNKQSCQKQIKKVIEKIDRCEEQSKTGTKCPLCPYQGKRDENIKRHIRFVHSNLRPHQCSKCNYAAKQTSDLNSDLNPNSLNSSPSSIPTCAIFPCSLCEFQGNTARQLGRHMKSHVLKMKTLRPGNIRVKIRA